MLPEVDGPVRERAVLVNKNTDKLLTVNSRHVNKSTFCDMLTVDKSVYFYTPPKNLRKSRLKSTNGKKTTPPGNNPPAVIIRETLRTVELGNGRKWWESDQQRNSCHAFSIYSTWITIISFYFLGRVLCQLFFFEYFWGSYEGMPGKLVKRQNSSNFEAIKRERW